MAETSIEIHSLPPTPPHNKSPTPPRTPKLSPTQPSSASTTTVVIDKTLSSAANLAKLLPTGTVLAFQTLSPSFSNRGSCYPSNKALTYALILVCSLSCVFFSLTDTLRGGDGKMYYGVATIGGLHVFNYEGSEEEKAMVLKDLSKYRIKALDVVHAVFTIVVFLALTFSDSEIQGCLFPAAGADAKQLLVNLPLGAAVLSSLVFMVFPTWRKGIGYSDSSPHERP